MNTTTTSTDAIAATVVSAPVVLTTAFAQYNAETRVSFVSKHDPKTQVNEGFRLSIVRYRDTTGKAAKPAQQAVVPALVVPDYVQFGNFSEPAESEDASKARELLAQKALEVFVGVLEDAQDSILRALIDAGITVIDWSAVTADKCIEFLTAARVSERLTKERIEAWVPVALGEVLDSRSKEISDKANHSEEDRIKQRAGTRNAYVAAFAKLAAAVPNIKQNEATALELLLNRTTSILRDGAAVDVGNPQDDIAKALRKKLDAILRPVILENTNL